MAVDECGCPPCFHSYSYLHNNALGRGSEKQKSPELKARLRVANTLSTQATSTGDFIVLPYIPINGAAIIVGTYLFIYFLMEPVAGASITPVIGVMLWYLNKLHAEYGSQAILVAG